jgi:hypothetical protein
MQAMKYGIFLVLGLALPACGDDSEGGGGDGNSGGSTSTGGSAGSGGSTSTGGSGGSGGSTSTGGSSGAGATGGSTSTGGSSGAGTTGGSTSTGGAAGSGGSGGGCMSGQVNLWDTPECQDFFDCIFDAYCATSGVEPALCVELLKQTISMTVPACGTPAEVMAACDMAKADSMLAAMYPQCVQ